MRLRTTFGGHSLARKSRAERRSISCSSEKAKSMTGLESVRPAVRRAGAAPWALPALGAPCALRRPPVWAGLKLFSATLFGLVLEMARDQAPVVEGRGRRGGRERGPKSPQAGGLIGGGSTAGPDGGAGAPGGRGAGAAQGPA